MRHRRFLLPLILLALPAGANGQSVWLGAGEARHSLALEVMKPGMDDGDFSTGTAAFVLSGRFRTSNSTRLVMEVPFTHAALGESPFGGGSRSSNVLGNPYLGMELGRLDGGPYLELGVRPPFLNESGDDDYGSAVGAISDIDRMEAFFDHSTSAVAFGNLRTRTEGGLDLRLRAGPVLQLTDKEYWGDSYEAYLAYGVYALREVGAGRLGAGISGRWILTEETDDLGDATVHQLGLFGDLKVGRLRPGVHLRLPVDKDMNDLLDYVVGVQLQVDLQ